MDSPLEFSRRLLHKLNPIPWLENEEYRLSTGLLTTANRDKLLRQIDWASCKKFKNAIGEGLN